MTFRLRDAGAADAGAVLRMVRALATYERLAHEVVASEAHFARALAETPPRVRAMLAEAGGEPVGLCLWFYNFSTFEGRHGIYLEDLFVDPAHRGAGIGRAFLEALAARAVREDCARVEWSVLDWNEDAIRFYRSIGATPMENWTIYRLTSAALTELGSGAYRPQRSAEAEPLPAGGTS